MEIEKYIENVKKMMTHGFSENIICRILEEEGKDRRTNTMYGKDEITQGEPQKHEIEGSKGTITEKQTKILLKASKNPQGLEFLNSKNINKEEDILRLSSKEASKIIKEIFELNK